MSDPITPRDVLQSVASAIPQDLRGDIIIVGSLAAAYRWGRRKGDNRQMPPARKASSCESGQCPE
jgi:hypothetical protein